MEQVAAQKHYGNTVVNGQSVLHQGDDNRHVVNHIRVGTVTLALPAGLRLKSNQETGPRAQLLLQAPPVDVTERLRNKDHTRRTLSGLTKKSRGRRKRICEPHLAPPRGSSSERQIQVNQSGYGGRDGKDVQMGPLSQKRALNLDRNEGSVRAGQEFLLVCALILSFVLGRHVSAMDVITFLHHCQDDQLLPALTFIFGIGLYRYVTANSLIKQPTGRSHLTLQLASNGHGLHSVEMAISFDFVKRLLHGHQQRKDGRMQAMSFRQDEFHLILGSRLNVSIPTADGAAKLCLSNSDNARRQALNVTSAHDIQGACLTCRAMFSASLGRESYCVWCNSFHADFETMFRKLPHTTAQDTVNNEGMRLYQRHLRKVKAAPHSSQPVSESDVQCRIILDGLTNLRIKIGSQKYGESSTLSGPPFRARASYTYYGSHANIFHLHANDVVVVHQTANDGLHGIVCIFDNQYLTVLQDNNIAISRLLRG